MAKAAVVSAVTTSQRIVHADTTAVDETATATAAETAVEIASATITVREAGAAAAVAGTTATTTAGAVEVPARPAAGGMVVTAAAVMPEVEAADTKECLNNKKIEKRAKMHFNVSGKS